MEEKPEVIKVEKKLKERLVKGKMKGRKFVSKNEREELHWR